MPFTHILIHYIWSTKERQKIITKQLKPILLDHIKTNSIEKGIFINRMNCVEDHIHLLISLSRDQTVSKVAQLIKGESSNWLNKSDRVEGLKHKFEWQDEYGAFSVSQSNVEKISLYIEKQEQHHKKETFQQEYERFIKACG